MTRFGPTNYSPAQIIACLEAADHALQGAAAGAGAGRKGKSMTSGGMAAAASDVDVFFGESKGDTGGAGELFSIAEGDEESDG